MTEKIYLLDYKLEISENENKKSISYKRAYDCPEKAFEEVQNIIKDESRCDKNVKWVYDFDTPYSDTVKIIGKGIFRMFYNDEIENVDSGEGTCTVTLAQIYLYKDFPDAKDYYATESGAYTHADGDHTTASGDTRLT